MRVAAVVLCASIGALDIVEAHAQHYPVRPVRIMVGYPPGGGVDVGARIVAQGLSEVWGTTNAIVDNRPGGTGSIATDITGVRTETDRWRKVVREANIPPE